MSSMLQTNNASFINEIYVHQLCRDMKDISLEGPTRVGYYSFYRNDKNEAVYCPDKSSLTYLDLPSPVYINCLQGYNSYTKYGHFIPGDMLILRWVLENETTMQKFPSDFICYNGVLKDMMTIQNSLDWNLSAIKIGGKIVLNKLDSIEWKKRVDTQTETVNKAAYVADNLQRFITKRNPSHGSSGRSKESFFGVFHSKIGSHQILHAGYLDCVDSERDLDKPFDEMKFVSIKRFNGPHGSHTSFHAESWWSLATFAGIDTVVRVKCERDFTVRKIDKLDVQSLIYKSRQMAFFAALNTVLDHVKSIVKEENKCYKLSFSAKNRKLTSYMMMDLDESAIPSWYIDQQIPIEC